MTIPLHTDAHGIIRVSGTRVTLDVILACYQQGDTPETIHQGFETVPLNDIYAVISYYLAHREAVDAYLDHNRREAERIRQEIEANYTPAQKASVERLLALKRQRSEA